MRLLNGQSAKKRFASRQLTFTTLLLAACSMNMALADATLTYQLNEPDGTTTVKQFSLARFFVRVDDQARNKYLLYQAGKFFPLFSVSVANATYQRMTPPVSPTLGPESRSKKMADKTAPPNNPKPATNSKQKAAPILKLTKKRRNIAGIDCRVVLELRDGKPVIEHCMANSARLGITDRELITMSRLFMMSRDRKYGWLGVGTEDEEFISIQSRDLVNKRSLQLTTVSTQPLPEGYLKIPRTYRQVTCKRKSN